MLVLTKRLDRCGFIEATSLVQTLEKIYQAALDDDEDVHITRILEGFSIKEHIAWLLLKAASDDLITEEEKELIRKAYLR